MLHYILSNVTDVSVCITHQLFLSTCPILSRFACLCFFFFLLDFVPETQSANIQRLYVLKSYTLLLTASPPEAVDMLNHVLNILFNALHGNRKNQIHVRRISRRVYHLQLSNTISVRNYQQYFM